MDVMKLIYTCFPTLQGKSIDDILSLMAPAAPQFGLEVDEVKILMHKEVLKTPVDEVMKSMKKTREEVDALYDSAVQKRTKKLS